MGTARGLDIADTRDSRASFSGRQLLQLEGRHVCLLLQY